MRIQHNIMAMNAYRNYTNNVSAMKKNLEKLSSGYKINRAGDDAAGLAISEKMRAQITGLEAAQKNAKDGISLVQTAEGALTEVHDMLNRMVELATQSANGTYDNTTDRAALQQELDQLKSEIDRISKATNFNGIDLLSGNYATKSNSAVGELLADLGVNGSAPTAAGAAEIKFKLTDAAAGAAEVVDVTATTDGGTMAAAVKGEITIKLGGLTATDIPAVKSGAVGAANGTTITAGGDVTAADWQTGNTLVFEIDGADVTITGTGTDIEADVNGALNKYGITASVDGGKLKLAPTAETLTSAGMLVTANDATDTDAEITSATTAADIKGFYVKDGTNYYKIEEFFDVTGDATNGFKLTAKTAGNLVDNATTPANKIVAALKGLTSDLDGVATDITDINADAVLGGAEITTTGTDEGLAAPAAPSTTVYNLDLDWSKITGGTELTIGNQTFKFMTDGTASSGGTAVTGANNPDAGKFYVDISKVPTTATAADKAKAISDALKTEIAANGTLGTAGKFNLVQDAAGKITLTGKDGTSADKLAETNLGEVRCTTNGVLKANTTFYTPVQYQEGEDAATSPFATATYNIGTMGEGSKLYIGDKMVEIVAATTDDADLKPGQVKMNTTPATLNTAIQNAFEAQGIKTGMITVDTAAKTLTITGTTVGETGEDLAKKFTVKSLASDAVPTPSEATLGSNTIKAGTTKISDIKNWTVDSKKLGDNFTIKVNGKVAKDTDTIAEGDEITITAKKNGKLSDTAMTNLTVGGDVVTSSVSNGYDEGSTAAGDKTTYKLEFDMAKLAGGNTFTIGNVDGKSYTFEISFDNNADKNGNDGTIGERDDQKEEVVERTSINLYGMSEKDAAAAISNAINDKMSTNFVKTDSLVGGKLTVNLTAVKEGSDYNLGNIRISSQSGSIKGEYNPAGGAANGTEGTYAQVTYAFDASKIQSGDTLKVGDTTIYFGKESKAERVDGKTKITVSADEAKTDPSKIVAALESAGYRSGQVQFTENNTKMTITGIQTGETAAALANAGGKVTLGNVDGRAMTTGGLTLQIGDTADTYNQLTVNIESTDCESLGINDISVADQPSAQAAVDVIKSAINKVSTIRGNLGATQNRLDHTINNLSVMTENIQDAESTIRDTDVADEMMAYTKNNILIQSAQAMLAQANQVPQGVLQLLQ